MACYTSAHFTLRTDIRALDAERLLQVLAVLRDTHLERLGLASAAIPPIPLTVFETRADFDASAQSVDARMVGARGATTARGVFVYFGPSKAACMSVLAHELTHAYLRAADKRLAPWLNEGLACYFGGLRRAESARPVFGVTQQERLIVVVRALRARKHVPLRQLLAVPKHEFHAGRAHNAGANSRERLLHGEASTLVRFLMHSKAEHIKGKFKRFLQTAYRMGQSSEHGTRQAFEAVYGSDYERIERLWTSYVMGLVK